MVALIMFRDMFVTGLRMVIEKQGFSMVTSFIAKTKTTMQYILIMFTLGVLGLKAFSPKWAIPGIKIINNYNIIYNLTLFITLFTILTGLTYLYDNRKAIKQFVNENES